MCWHVVIHLVKYRLYQHQRCTHVTFILYLLMTMNMFVLLLHATPREYQSVTWHTMIVQYWQMYLMPIHDNLTNGGTITFSYGRYSIAWIIFWYWFIWYVGEEECSICIIVGCGEEVVVVVVSKEIVESGMCTTTRVVTSKLTTFTRIDELMQSC